jgi:hypothetical protein
MKWVLKTSVTQYCFYCFNYERQPGGEQVEKVIFLFIVLILLSSWCFGEETIKLLVDDPSGEIQMDQLMKEAHQIDNYKIVFVSPEEGVDYKSLEKMPDSDIQYKLYLDKRTADEELPHGFLDKIYGIIKKYIKKFP